MRDVVARNVRQICRASRKQASGPIAIGLDAGSRRRELGFAHESGDQLCHTLGVVLHRQCPRVLVPLEHSQ